MSPNEGQRTIRPDRRRFLIKDPLGFLSRQRVDKGVVPCWPNRHIHGERATRPGEYIPMRDHPTGVGTGFGSRCEIYPFRDFPVGQTSRAIRVNSGMLNTPRARAFEPG